ncbi:hypothetical protein N7481_005763 [Penicillium waksmanii]|uniref:uncharacterized protein n=1 Tax=Penicillium waksmanii TaxID=69791 RepID=UPI0025497EA9|nr:uncharacterized protein N7481_005763 [Penicillium waksmanii]KAJ5983664.1 hypothetical protein N7481_005763 [Penicillium waksmanii]
MKWFALSLPNRPAGSGPANVDGSQKAQTMSVCGPRIGFLVSLLFVLNSTGVAAGLLAPVLGMPR